MPLTDSFPSRSSLSENPSENARREIGMLKMDLADPYRRVFPEFSENDVRFLRERRVSPEFLGTLSELRKRYLGPAFPVFPRDVSNFFRSDPASVTEYFRLYGTVKEHLAFSEIAELCALGIPVRTVETCVRSKGRLSVSVRTISTLDFLGNEALSDWTEYASWDSSGWSSDDVLALCGARLNGEEKRALRGYLGSPGIRLSGPDLVSVLRQSRPPSARTLSEYARMLDSEGIPYSNEDVIACAASGIPLSAMREYLAYEPRWTAGDAARIHSAGNGIAEIRESEPFFSGLHKASVKAEMLALRGISGLCRHLLKHEETLGMGKLRVPLVPSGSIVHFVRGILSPFRSAEPPADAAGWSRAISEYERRTEAFLEDDRKDFDRIFFLTPSPEEDRTGAF